VRLVKHVALAHRVLAAIRARIQRRSVAGPAAKAACCFEMLARSWETHARWFRAVPGESIGTHSGGATS
jgi:hypothetical protein